MKFTKLLHVYYLRYNNNNNNNNNNDNDNNNNNNNNNNNFLLTEHEGRTKTTGGQYSPVRSRASEVSK